MQWRHKCKLEWMQARQKCLTASDIKFCFETAKADGNLPKLSSVDTVEVVSEYVPMKQKGRRYWGCCPFHSEKTASFSVDTEAQLYYCFGCHEGGTVINFIMEIERMEFMDAVRLLADRAHMEVPARSRRPGDSAASREERDRLYGVNRTAARYFHDLLWTQDGAEALNAAGIDAYFPILRRVVTLEEALSTAEASANLAATVEQTFRCMFYQTFTNR